MCHLDHRRRFPIKIIGRVIWILILQLSSTGRLVTKWKEETLKRTKFDRDTLNEEKHDKVTDPTSTGRPVSGQKIHKRCVLTPRHVKNDQTCAERPVTVNQKEEHQIDFRVPGLSLSVVKEAEHLRVQELVKKDRSSSSSRSTSCRLAAE